MICNCIKNAGLDYDVFKEDLQKNKLTESLKIDLHIAREMEIEQSAFTCILVKMYMKKV